MRLVGNLTVESNAGHIGAFRCHDHRHFPTTKPPGALPPRLTQAPVDEPTARAIIVRGPTGSSFPGSANERIECRNTIRPSVPVGIDHQPIKGGMSAPDTGDGAMRRQTEPERQLTPPRCGFFFTDGTIRGTIRGLTNIDFDQVAAIPANQLLEVRKRVG